jgi:hypothetical protein
MTIHDAVHTGRLQGMIPSKLISPPTTASTKPLDNIDREAAQRYTAQQSKAQCGTERHLYVTCHVAKLLLDLTYSLEVSRAVESITSQHEQLYQVLCDVSPCHI